MAGASRLSLVPLDRTPPRLCATTDADERFRRSPALTGRGGLRSKNRDGLIPLANLAVNGCTAGEGVPGRQLAERAAGPPDQTEREAPRWRPGFRTQGIGLSAGCGSRPPLSATKLRSMPARQRPVKQAPTPPSEEVAALQDPTHTEDDFLRDLEKASTNRSKELLEQGDPSRPDRGSSGT